VRNLEINDVDACLWLRMIRRSVPFARLAYDVIETFDRNASPLSARRKARTAGTSELKEQGLQPAILRPDCVRTHLADMSFVGRNDLMLVDDRLSYERVRI